MTHSGNDHNTGGNGDSVSAPLSGTRRPGFQDERRRKHGDLGNFDIHRGQGKPLRRACPGRWANASLLWWLLNVDVGCGLHETRYGVVDLGYAGPWHGTESGSDVLQSGSSQRRDRYVEDISDMSWPRDSDSWRVLDSSPAP